MIFDWDAHAEQKLSSIALPNKAWQSRTSNKICSGSLGDVAASLRSVSSVQEMVNADTFSELPNVQEEYELSHMPVTYTYNPQQML